MPRFGSRQPDLFAPTADAEPAAPDNPLAELAALLARLRAADRMPWPDAATAMAEELHALGLARQAGPEGRQLAAAILDATERLLATTD
jgi:hypothetical protein